MSDSYTDTMWAFSFSNTNLYFCQSNCVHVKKQSVVRSLRYEQWHKLMQHTVHTMVRGGPAQTHLKIMWRL